MPNEEFNFQGIDWGKDAEGKSINDTIRAYVKPEEYERIIRDGRLNVIPTLAYARRAVHREKMVQNGDMKRTDLSQAVFLRIEPDTEDQQARIANGAFQSVLQWINGERSLDIVLDELRLFPVVAEGWKHLEMEDRGVGSRCPDLAERITNAVQFTDTARSWLLRLTDGTAEDNPSFRRDMLQDVFVFTPTWFVEDIENEDWNDAVESTGVVINFEAKPSEPKIG